MQTGNKIKPTVKVQPLFYQPKHADLREELKIKTTPEKPAKTIL